MNHSADLSTRLRGLRQRERLTVAQAAERAGVSPRQWNRWEHRDAAPGYRSIEKIATAFAITPDALTGASQSQLAAGCATQADVARLERKLDALLDHLGVHGS